jgi:phosphohistidine swiveling domain-containing protein
MKEISLDSPIFGLDETSLKNDIALARKQGLHNAFTRRRVVFFMDGYRYAHDAAQKRWGIKFVFYETGREQVKRVYQSETLNEDGARVWMERMDHDPSFGQKLVRELLDVIEIEKRLIETIPNKPLTPAGVEEALRLHLDWWIKFFEPAFLWFAVDPIKEATDARIRKEWAGTPDQLGSFIEHVYRPMKLPLSSAEQRDIVALARLSGEAFEKALQQHWSKYKHLALHNIDDEYFDITYYRGRAKDIADPAEYEHQKEILETADREIKEANDMLRSAPISDELRKRIEFIRWFMYLRTESIDHMMLVASVYKPIFELLASNFGIPIDAVLHMTYKEIIDSLRGGMLVVAKDIVLDRTQNGYAYFIGPEHSALVVGAEVEKLEKLCRPQAEQACVKELRGQIAFKGKVRGPARVILDRRKSSELKEGEILVTTMTSPDFVPAMKISAGIITNEGGVLCHAAIMSRELRKPCIIGTKIATDVIKTGQMVTIDAVNGIVIIDERK